MKKAVSILTALVLLTTVSCNASDKEVQKQTSQSTSVSSSSSEEIIESASISGSFAGTIVDLYPDYVLDDFTIRKALIKIPQTGLFLLNIDENINVEQIEKDKLYRFTIQEHDFKDDKLSLVLNSKSFFSREGGTTLLNMFGKEIVIDTIEEEAESNYENTVKITIE